MSAAASNQASPPLLSAPRLQALQAAGARAFDLQGGCWLFRQGEPGDAVYVLLQGRLQAWTESAGDTPPRLLGELLPGHWVGEAALLSGQPRSASVRAARDSRLLRLDRAALQTASQALPELGLELAALLAERLHANSLAPTPPPSRLRSLSLLPLDASSRVLGFCSEIERLLRTQTPMLGLRRDALLAEGAPCHWAQSARGSDPALAQWLAAQEMQGRALCLHGEADDGGDARDWNGFCLRQADTVLVVADATAASTLRPWEAALQQLEAAPTGVRRLLVLLQPGRDQPLGGTAAWLSARPLDAHLHVRSGCPQDLARLLRVLRGDAQGLVLGGGAARGFAHLGVYRALIEAGEPIDFVGGTSIGAILGAAIAKGWPPDEAIVRAREAFVRGRPFSDFTLPLVAVLRGARMEALIRSHLPGCIEDLPLPFYCVSSNLASGTPNLHRRGLLWRALRASAALPGVLPPAVVDGELAVDGAVLDNLPVAQMRALPVGRVIAVDLGNRQRRQVPFEQVPGTVQRVWARLCGRRLPVPGLATVVLKSLEAGGAARVEAQAAAADLLLRPPVQRFGMTDVGAFDAIVEAGYRHALEVLEGRAPALAATGALQRGPHSPAPSPALAEDAPSIVALP
jgi:predicted acylesterase/phospholipase RssA/CRP-like cAMP-binding protein